MVASSMAVSEDFAMESPPRLGVDARSVLAISALCETIAYIRSSISYPTC